MAYFVSHMQGQICEFLYFLSNGVLFNQNGCKGKQIKVLKYPNDVMLSYKMGAGLQKDVKFKIDLCHGIDNGYQLKFL